MPRHAPSTTSTPAKPSARPSARSRVGRSSGSVSEHDEQDEERRRPVPDAREQRRDVLLSEREERERRAVDEHRGDEQVPPRAPVARKAAAPARTPPARVPASPKSMRPNETCTGVKPRFPILMSTNDMPQIAPSSASRAGHEVARRLTRRALEVEQEALRSKTAAVAGERAVRADHAVARDQDRDGVCAVRRAGGADRRRAPDAPGELRVRDRLAVADALQLVPDALLERRAARRDRQVERPAPAGEVLGELHARGAERGGVAHASRQARRARRPAGGGRQTAVLGGQEQLADRARDRRVRHAHGSPPLSSAPQRCRTA